MTARSAAANESHVPSQMCSVCLKLRSQRSCELVAGSAGANEVDLSPQMRSVCGRKGDRHIVNMLGSHIYNMTGRFAGAKVIDILSIC